MAAAAISNFIYHS